MPQILLKNPIFFPLLFVLGFLWPPNSLALFNIGSSKSTKLSYNLYSRRCKLACRTRIICAFLFSLLFFTHNSSMTDVILISYVFVCFSRWRLTTISISLPCCLFSITYYFVIASDHLILVIWLWISFRSMKKLVRRSWRWNRNTMRYASPSMISEMTSSNLFLIFGWLRFDFLT